MDDRSHKHFNGLSDALVLHVLVLVQKRCVKIKFSHEMVMIVERSA